MGSPNRNSCELPKSEESFISCTWKSVNGDCVPDTPTKTIFKKNSHRRLWAFCVVASYHFSNILSCGIFKRKRKLICCYFCFCTQTHVSVKGKKKKNRKELNVSDYSEVWKRDFKDYLTFMLLISPSFCSVCNCLPQPFLSTSSFCPACQASKLVTPREDPGPFQTDHSARETPSGSFDMNFQALPVST